MNRNSIRIALAGLCTTLAFTSCSVSFGTRGATPPVAPPTSAPTEPAASDEPTTGPTTGPTTEPTTSRPSGSPSTRPSDGAVPRITVEVAIMNKIKDETGDTVIVDCPADLAGAVGTRMTCEWSAIDTKGQMEVEVTSIDPSGRVNFVFRKLS